MDTVTLVVLAIAAGGAVLAGRGRLLRNPWNFMLVAKLNRKRAVQAADGVLGGSTAKRVEQLAARHFGGSFDGVTVDDLFPALCGPEWQEALAVLLGCLVRHRRVPQSFRPSWDQYE